MVTFVESLFGEHGQQDNSSGAGEVIRDPPGLIRVVEAKFEKSGTEGFGVGEIHLIADFGEAFDERKNETELAHRQGEHPLFYLRF